ncbi:MAG: PAS domain S-box protein [Desulfarculus sp.]|nr:PAS domain S-box protein [Desulfarculus sp.]
MLPQFVPAYSVGPLIGLVANGLLALLCLVILLTYRSYRPLKYLLLFYLTLCGYFLGFTLYGYQLSERSIVGWYRLMLLSLCFAPVAWVWFACSLQDIRPGRWAWGCLGFSLVLAAVLLMVEHPLVLGPPLVWQPHAGTWHPQAKLFRPVVYAFDLAVVLTTIILFWFRWWRGPGKPAYVRAILAGLSIWFFGGLHDAAFALHMAILPFNVMWLGSIWLSLCLALAMAFHLRDLDEAVKISEAKFSRAFALNPDCLTIATLEQGRLLEANEAFLRITGLERHQALGKSFDELGVHPQGGLDRRWIQNLVVLGSLRDRETRLILPQGQSLEVLWSAEIIQFGGDPCVLTVIRDVTERKRAEAELEKYRHHLEDLVNERTAELSQANRELQYEIAERRRTEDALRQSRAELQTLFDSLQDFLFVLDDQGRVVAVNPPVSERLGYGQEELLGRELCLLHPPERREEAAGIVATIIAGNSDRSHLPLMTKAGALVPVETRVTRGRWGDRQVFFGISRDISERQRAQEVLRQLAAGVAHNFNNLLAAILGNAQAAESELRGPDPDRGRLGQLLDNVVHGAISGRGLVQRLAAYVGGRRPQDGGREVAEVGEVAAAAIKIAQAAWRPHAQARVEFFTDLRPGLWVGAQRDELMEVFLNLLRNALEAMPQGGRLAVNAAREGEQAVIRFSDTGLGMGPETARRLFEPFFSTKGVAGQGLGLASSRGIVRAYGGDITVQSVSGQGTTFLVTLPLGPAASAQEGPAPAPPGAVPGARVLLVEDEALVAMGVRALLEDAGYQVRLAANVSEALVALEAFAAQAVLCDLGLPDGSGWEVAASLASRPGDPLPFILVTGWSTDLTIIEPPPGVPPARAVLHKPVDRSLLLYTLAQALAG